MDLMTRVWMVLALLAAVRVMQPWAGSLAESDVHQDSGSVRERLREKLLKDQGSSRTEHKWPSQTLDVSSRTGNAVREIVSILDKSIKERHSRSRVRTVRLKRNSVTTNGEPHGEESDPRRGEPSTNIQEIRLGSKTYNRSVSRARRDVQDLDPPRLNVTEETVVSVGVEFWSVRCEGEEDLAWNFSYIQQPEEKVQITFFERNGTNANFVSIATVSHPLADDTGLIECYYKESLLKDSTYIYFEDETLPILYPLDQFLPVTTAEILVIDCRLTNPKYIVVLKKDGQQVASSSTPAGGRWTYSPQRGFELDEVQLQDSGAYECNDTGITIVQVTRASEERLPSPVVLPPHNTHFVVGHSFTLSCLAISSSDIRFSWNWPPNVEHPDITEEHLSSPPQEASHLTVFNATSMHSGTYTCRIMSPGTLPSRASYTVSVNDAHESYANITSQITKITEDEGKNITWRAQVRSFPGNPEIIFHNKDGVEIERNDRIRTTVNMRKGEVALEWFNVSRSDFGNYSISVVTSDGKAQDSATVMIQIKSKPFVKIPLVPGIPLNESRRVVCEVLASPQPEVTWQFKACPPEESLCEEFSNVTEPLQMNVSDSGVVTWTDWTGETSGFLRCEAENDKGTDSAIAAISVTDIDYSYVFSFTDNENQTRILTSDREVVNVIEDDSIEIFCGAIHFLYDFIEMNVPEKSSITVKNTTTLLSTSLTSGRTYVALNDGGSYTCGASVRLEDPATSKASNKTLILKVRQQRHPVFLDNNNVSPVGNEITVDENKEFVIFCSVDGVPTPHITWAKDGDTFRPYDRKISISKDGQRIMFAFVSAEDAGDYECTAKNRLDSISASISLDVNLRGKALTTGGIVALGVIVVALIILAAFVIYLSKRVKKERKHRKSFKNIEILMFKEGRIGQLNPASTIDEQAELLPYDDSWEIPRANISTGAQLGSGAFGRVVKGKIFGFEQGRASTTVAIKMCKSSSDAAQLRALASELKIMIHLGKHLNIVNLVGASTVNVGKGELWIMVEFCRYGDLLKYIHKHRHLFINQIDPETDTIDPAVLSGEPLSPYPRSRTGGSTMQDSAQGSLGPLSPGASSVRYHSSTSSSSQSASTLVPHSEGGLYAGNPGYQGPLENTAGSPSPSVGPGSPPVFPSSSANSSTPLVRDRALSNQSTAVGFQQMISSDRTPVSMSPSPMPLSPTLSLPASECPVDSQGNPFTFELVDIPGETAPFTTSDLVCWAWQVAQGMEYLTHRKVLHGDLALRNLLLAYPNVVKISDFGLARDIYKREFYEKKSDDLMPIKWMSMEAIRDRIFTSQSDVWAFGVVLWELFTLGNTPYPSINVDKNFLKLLEEGYRMEKPKFSNDELYSIMIDCWDEDPTLRPKFEDISDRLTDLLRPELKGHYVNMNEPYLKMNQEKFQDGNDVIALLARPDYELMHSNQPGDPNYVNMSGYNPTTRTSDYLNMKGPEMVTYSCAGPSAAGETSGAEGGTQAPKVVGNTYLPMTSASTDTGTGTDTGANIFSPRPVNDNPRFTFDEEQFEGHNSHLELQPTHCV